MNDKLDLWGDVTNDVGNTISALSLIKEQSALLETKTNGKVKADFSPIHYQYKQDSIAMVQGLLGTVAALSRITPSKEEVYEYDERRDLEDASKLYEQCSYKFEIYSNKYKYRLFTLDYKSVYPLSIEIEFGILDDKAITKTIKSIGDLKNVLSTIFASNKVKFIIQKMIELDS